MSVTWDAQKALIQLLVDAPSVSAILREGLDLELVPKAELRPVVEWAITYFRESGKAPTIPVIEDRWGDLLSDCEIDMEEDPEDAIEQVLTTLQESYARKEAGRLTTAMAKEVGAARPEDRAEVFLRMAYEAVESASRLIPRTTVTDLRDGALDMLAEYDRIVETGNPIRGMTFGLDEIDEYTHGIWPGELCVVAAPPKSKKSWFADWIAYHEWRRERICPLYTLENSIEMTIQRIACMACNVSISELMTGRLSDEDYEKITWWTNDVLGKSDVPLPILNPDTAGRTPAAVVAQAKAFGADSLVVDQLSHLESAVATRATHEEIWENTSALKDGIKIGRRRLPTLLIHQINREGQKALESEGRVRMYHSAGGSGVERNADHLFVLAASEEETRTGLARIMPVAVRRLPEHPGWQLNWTIDVGRLSVASELEAA